MIPAGAFVYVPLLAGFLGEFWPAAPEPWTMAAQIERETCVTLKSRTCFSPYAELKTSRENGVGLGQVTRGFNANGTIRFDKQAELRQQFPRELGDWTWGQRYDASKQLTALVLMDRTGHARYSRLMATPDDAWAATLSGYNGGDGAVAKDILLCKTYAACNPRVWFGNVEIHSTKSKQSLGGVYSQSPYVINRSYVRQVFDRRDAYRDQFWGTEP